MNEPLHSQSVTVTMSALELGALVAVFKQSEEARSIFRVYGGDDAEARGNLRHRLIRQFEQFRVER